jgi:argininosuccinate lyase
MSKLWQKEGAVKLNSVVERYTVGEDYLLDRVLFPYDIIGTLAHAKALAQAKVISLEELSSIQKTLKALAELVKSGDVTISIEDEDCHTVMENYLVSELGDLGKKIHTGRSRNDQSLVALRLFMKENLLVTQQLVKKLAEEILVYAKKYRSVAMPGYTHTQQAMLTSVGHHMLSFVESLLDDFSFLDSVLKHIDKNPLGSAAGFGSNVPLDRELTTKELGFASTQINSIYCQSSRGKFESVYLEGVNQIMMTLGRLAADFLMFTTREFSFFEVAADLTTGSSIMPQKKNLDLLEVLRANLSVCFANKEMVQGISKGLPSGYNRDYQLIKKAVIQSTSIVQDSLQLISVFIGGIKPKSDEILTKTQDDIYSADLATQLSFEKGIPFRDAYQEVMTKFKDGFRALGEDPQKVLQGRATLGAPGNDALSYYESLLISL